jgi:hypothetical protein
MRTLLLPQVHAPATVPEFTNAREALNRPHDANFAAVAAESL